MVERVTIFEKEMDILWRKGNYTIEDGTIKLFKNNDVFAVGGFHGWLKHGTEDWKALQSGNDLLKNQKLSLFERLLFVLYRMESKIFGKYFI